MVSRYAPERSFPPYAFVPGRAPHPVRDPQGHSYRREPEGSDDELYRWGIDLYNHGYLWEAHEAWEQVWRRATLPVERAFYQGLIQCAAACLKRVMEQPRGARTLADRALARLREVIAAAGPRYRGLDLGAFAAAFAAFAAGEPPAGPRPLLALAV